MSLCGEPSRACQKGLPGWLRARWRRRLSPSAASGNLSGSRATYTAHTDSRQPAELGDRRRPVRDAALADRHLVGRDEELTAVVRLIDASEQLPGVAALAGEAGIGKTTLWLAGIDAAAVRGYRILS